ncbi:MAG: adenosylmethionine decarboxylase [Spirochaetales bacterium]|nr:adenosylmethionine decarboxylase [Spirochaetales bacterium]
MEDPLGEHYIIELYDCNSDVLNDYRKIEDTLLESARIAGATIIDQRFHQFNPHGVSGVVVIAESHLSIHTWPEHGYAALDLFTCSHDMNIDRALDLLKTTFEPADMEVRLIRRGVTNKHLRRLQQPHLEPVAV